MDKTKTARKSFPVNQQKKQAQSRIVNQIPPNPTRQPRTMIPPPQSSRIIQRYVAGESIRQIAREERRDRATVTKIVRSEEMNAFVHQMRERLYGLGADALAAVEYELRVRKNGRLGYQLLADIGIVPSLPEKLEIGYQPVKIDRSALTPFQIAIAEEKDGSISRVGYGMACAIQASAECYGFPLPTPEDIRHSRRVAEVADQITNGNFSRICFADGGEEKRIRGLAEQIVRREESQKALPRPSVN